MKIKICLIIVFIIMFMSGAIFLQINWAEDTKETPGTSKLCPGAWYTSETCSGPKDKCESATGKPCTADEKCDCIEQLKKGTGIISGTISADFLKKYSASQFIEKYPAVVYIDKIEGRTFEPPAQQAKLDQVKLVFTPRVLPILKGASVLFHNSDKEDHNVFSPDGEKFDLGTWGYGGKKDYVFKNTGSYSVLCNVHPEMIASVIVLDNPYFKLVDAESKGNFRIPNVPAGTYVLKVWVEKIKELKTVYKLFDKKTFEVIVKEGQETEVKINPDPEKK